MHQAVARRHQGIGASSLKTRLLENRRMRLLLRQPVRADLAQGTRSNGAGVRQSALAAGVGSNRELQERANLLLKGPDGSQEIAREPHCGNQESQADEQAPRG